MSTAVLDESTVESAALRDALLPKLIRGEIRVKDAEQLVSQHVSNIQKED